MYGGKIGHRSDNRWMERVPTSIRGVFSFEYTEEAKRELNRDTRTLPTFRLKDIWTQKFVQIERDLIHTHEFMSGKRELIYPKGERVWVGYYNTNHELILILTSKESRDYYYLYELVDGGFKKLGRARSPVELEERFEVNKRLVVTP